MGIADEIEKRSGMSGAPFTDPINRAARLGRLDVVCQLVQSGVALNGRDKDGWTPLMDAVVCGREECALGMARIGGKLGAVWLGELGGANKSGLSADILSLAREVALATGEMTILENALKRGGAAGGRSGHGVKEGAWRSDKKLLKAVENGDLEGIKEALAKGANASELKDSLGRGLLEICLVYEHVEAFKFLCEKGLTTTMWNAVSGARRMNKPWIIEMALDSGWGTEWEAAWSSMLGPSWEDGALLALDRLSSDEVNEKAPFSKDNQRKTLLHLAARMGNIKSAEKLLKMGARIEARTEDLETPLMLAVAYGDENMSMLLLENGADRNVMNVSGVSALNKAIMGKSRERVLVELTRDREVKEKLYGEAEIPMNVAKRIGGETLRVMEEIAKMKECAREAGEFEKVTERPPSKQKKRL